GGTGGNAISEGTLAACPSAPCQFPGQPAVGFKFGLQFVQSQSNLGNFQQGRAQSYHYALFGHTLGEPRSFWSAAGAVIGGADVPQLSPVVQLQGTATVTLLTPGPAPALAGVFNPAGIVKPGDCPNAVIPACSDANSGTLTISGALAQPLLNGTYTFAKKDVN